ncbi:acyltransferase family protein [Yersinia enterocolitica]|uniref:acyltransferase family protein n=1 Tax=Yersinia enterocolitica TaxID=630 RepID=UPI0028B91538|nr:acyltransferase [Yersinia enterocolitica]HDM8092951.1 acyltransferase [Yersinia enterocolitica]
MTDKSPEAKKNQPNKVYELESIRGVAALLIILVHIPSWNSNFYDWRFITNAYLMVELFFVLSGYVIYNAYANNISTGKDLVKFQFLRFARLYPVHILFLSVYVAIEIAKYIASVKFGVSSPNSKPFVENNFIALLQNIFLVQAIGSTGNHLTFNGPSWTISVEFYTYFIFGLVALLFNKYRNPIFISLFVLSIVLIATQTTFGFVSLLRCFAGFFAGCFVAVIKNRINLIINPVCSLLTLIAMIVFISFKEPLQYDWIVYLFAGVLIFTLTSSEGGVLKRILNFKILIWLGTISYSLYMCHYSVIWVTSQVIRFVFKRPEKVIANISAPQLTNLEAAFGYFAVLSISLVLGALVYKYIESPLRLRSREVSHRSMTINKKHTQL